MVLLEDTTQGDTIPYVDVHFATQLNEDDPALQWIGFVIKCKLQEGMH